jgi:uncharacterized protein
MAGNYLRTLFGETARALQEADGSRASFARMEGTGEGPDLLGEAEAAFIAERDSFYVASVTADGWPYVQHRGGPPGFLMALEGNRIGFADYRGNRQYISTANLFSNDRVSLFLMDYGAKRRLKLIGHAIVIPRADDPVLVEGLKPSGYAAVAERAYVIDVVGFDWNCPQHITPRFTEAEIKAGIAPLLAELNQVKAELAALRDKPD